VSECDCESCAAVVEAYRADLAAEKARADDALRERDAFDARCGVLSMHVDEVGIQLAAAQERLRLAMACVDCVRGALVRDDGIWTTTMRIAAIRALDALDAVPGDVLDTTGARPSGPDGEVER